MRAGDIIFVRGKSLLSDLIRRFDSGEFSHVAIAISDTDIYEAQFYKRANIVPMHYEDYEIVSLNLTDKEVEKLKVICGMLTGKWYDYWQVLGYVIKKPFNNPNNLICSEALGLILYVLDKIDEPLTYMKPNELYKFLGDAGVRK